MPVFSSGQEFSLNAFRQVLLEGLTLLATDEHRMRGLLSIQGNMPLNASETADAIVADRIDILKRMVRFGTRKDGGLHIYAGLPDTQRQMPFVTFNYSGDNSEIATNLGDIAHTENVTIGGKVYCEEVRGSYKRRTVTCDCLAATFEETIVLYAAVQHVLEHDKYALIDLGLCDLVTVGTPPETQHTDDELRFSQGDVSITYTWLQGTAVRHGPVNTRAALATALLGT